jgi:hypothetical protein
VWRIYYDDGSTFDSDQGTPEEAPGRGVQGIAQTDEWVGRQFIEGTDYYLYRYPDKDLIYSKLKQPEHNGQWIGVDLYGVIDHLIGLGKIKAGEWNPIETLLLIDQLVESGDVKAGRCLTNAEFTAVQTVMLDDPDFPPKSAWYAKERRKKTVE